MPGQNPMTTPLIEQTIRVQFSGPGNAGLRAKIRKIIAIGGDLNALHQGIAFTSLGHTKLRMIQQAVAESTPLQS